MRKRILWISAGIVLVVAAVLVGYFYKSSSAQTAPPTASATETPSVATPNEDPTESATEEDVELTEPSPAELNEMERVLSSGDSEGVAQLVSLSPDQLDPEFLAELQRMNLQLEMSSMTELESGLWGIIGTDDRDNSWHIALLRSGDPATLHLVGTEFLGGAQ